MAVRKTVQIGEPVLRETAKKVDSVSNPSVKVVIQDLVDTMREKELVGIAAPQLGESLRIFVSEIRETKFRTKEEVEPLTIYINPEIVSVSHETKLGYEGCGSVAHSGLFGQVERAREVTVKFTDETGVSREMNASGLLARIIQHENDHLNGVMFTDLCDPRTLVDREYYLKSIK